MLLNSKLSIASPLLRQYSPPRLQNVAILKTCIWHSQPSCVHSSNSKSDHPSHRQTVAALLTGLVASVLVSCLPTAASDLVEAILDPSYPVVSLRIRPMSRCLPDPIEHPKNSGRLSGDASTHVLKRAITSPASQEVYICIDSSET